MYALNTQADEIRRGLVDLHRRAEEFARKQRPQDASDCWRQMSTNYRKLARLETNVLESARLNKKALQCQARAQEPAAAREPAAASPEEPRATGECDAAVAGLLLKESGVTWADIGGMDKAKQDLKYAMGLQLAQRPEGVTRLDVPSRILLYGPPGGGKTLLAAAAANMLDASFFNVKVSDLLSKYFGESTRLISALYAKARDLADAGIAVVFIDEIESLVADRDRSESGAERRIISTFLAELDGLAQKSAPTQVITIAATNRPWDLDEAILSRMDLRIFVDYPDEATREAIFRIHLERRGHRLAEGLTYQELARRSEGLTGRDIERLCKRACAEMMAETNPGVVDKVDQGQIRDYVLKHRPFSRKDFTPLFVRKRSDSGSGINEQRRRFLDWTQRDGD